eukprot:8896865-Alexandrium_andersonii.AAC.1
MRCCPSGPTRTLAGRRGRAKLADRQKQQWWKAWRGRLLRQLCASPRAAPDYQRQTTKSNSSNRPSRLFFCKINNAGKRRRALETAPRTPRKAPPAHAGGAFFFGVWSGGAVAPGEGAQEAAETALNALHALLTL